MINKLPSLFIQLETNGFKQAAVKVARVMVKNAISKQDFSEAYALTAVSPWLEDAIPSELTAQDKKQLIKYRNDLIVRMAQYYATSLHNALITECSFIESRDWPEDEAQQAKLIAAGINESFDPATFTPDQFIVAFANLDWEVAYGGQKWERIAKLYKELLNALKTVNTKRNNSQYIAELMSLIDRINQIEHNTGSIFDKFGGKEIEWIEELLHEKATTDSFNFLGKHMSENVRKNINKLPVVRQDVPHEELRAQIGEVKLARYFSYSKQSIEDSVNDNIRLLKKMLKNDDISEPHFKEEIAKLEAQKKSRLERIENDDSIIKFLRSEVTADRSVDDIVFYLASIGRDMLVTSILNNLDICLSFSDELLNYLSLNPKYKKEVDKTKQYRAKFN